MASRLFRGSRGSRVNSERAIESSVRVHCCRENPNTGRKFYGCAQYQANGECGFFEWTEEPMSDREVDLICELTSESRRLEEEVKKYRAKEKLWCLILVPWCISLVLLVL